jgi:hypothetical protein
MFTVRNWIIIPKAMVPKAPWFCLSSQAKTLTSNCFTNDDREYYMGTKDFKARTTYSNAITIVTNYHKISPHPYIFAWLN